MRLGSLALVVTMVAPSGNAEAGRDRPGVIRIFAAYGTPSSFEVSGRLLEDKGIRSADKKRGRFGNLVDTVKAMESDEITGARLAVTIVETNFETTTDDDGVWRIAVNPVSNALPVGSIPFTVRLIDDKDHPTPDAKGLLHVLPGRPSVAVISDFDDTVVDSGVTDKKRLVYRTLTKNAAQLKPIAGVSKAYRLAEKAGARAIFYVSGSPQNLFVRIVEYLRLQKIPVGPILLKNIGEDSVFDQESYKVDRISHLMAGLPNTRFVLVGDSGEKDPEIYRAVSKKFPDRVVGIVIRRVPEAENAPARFAGMTTVDDYEANPEVVAAFVKGAFRAK